VVTRAVLLELVPDMTAIDFRIELQRFISRREVPSLIISDNGKTFERTERYLKRMSENEDLQGYLTSKRIKWSFNVVKALWQGGFFERMIGIAKSSQS